MDVQLARTGKQGGSRAIPRLGLLIVLVALAAFIPSNQLVHADTSACTPLNGIPCATDPPPDLLNLNQALYAASDGQKQSLENLETQAVANTILDHNLDAADTNAVESWGRYDAEAELFALIEQAIQTSRCSAAQSAGQGCRTKDQQNVVDWVRAVEQRQAQGAAEAAGREYVKWAGLSQLSYNQLLENSTLGSSDLQTFLCGGDCNAWQATVLNYNNPNTSQADGGYCVYRAPAPYGSEYTGYNDPTCFAPCAGILGCNPPTPTYDQFVKWGEADMSYSSLTSNQNVVASAAIARGLGFGGAALGAGLAGAAISSGLSGVFAGSEGVGTAIYPYLTRAYQTAAAEVGEEAAGEIVGEAASSAVGAVVGVLIVAITVAVMEGINVANAAALPGKLATLIVNARTTAPDPATQLSASGGASSLFGLFVGATQPVPRSGTCDNSVIPSALYGSGETWISPTGAMINTTPCLNPTPIRASAATDPQFLVQQRGDSTKQASRTITWTDTASRTTTARLSGNWFIDSVNGTTVQTLRIGYTDWNGNERVAWLLGDPKDGYHFLGFTLPTSTSPSIDPSTCVADGTCSYSSSLDYVGSDGQDYSASVRGYQPSVGSPAYANGIEGSPVQFDANGFEPGNATGPIHYQWRFQRAGCGIPCQTFDPTTLTSGPAYTDPVTGDTVTHAWQTSGSYLVELAATDANGVQATDTFTVVVADVPPSLQLSPPCESGAAPASSCDLRDGTVGGSPMSVTGTIRHTGTLDEEFVRVNWGDGSSDAAYAGALLYLGMGATAPTVTASANQLSFTLSASHSYTKPGVYYGTVEVSDGGGSTASQPFTETIHGTQSISFPAVPTHYYGDAPFTISGTGGSSGQPVQFASTDSTICSLSGATSGVDGSGNGTGSATVTVLKPGTCSITASQAGNGVYSAAPIAAQSFSVQPAPLTITASSPSITYGDTVPAVTPSYRGFVNNEDSSVLTTQATCSSNAPTGAAVGTYRTTCTGASDPNYDISYVPGTLTIDQAPLTVTANDKSMTYGGSLPSFDAGFSGFLNGDTGSVVSGLTCGALDKSNDPVSGSTPAGQYAITCSAGSAANYALNYHPGTLTINKANTSTTLASAPAPSVFGQPVTLTASITIMSPGSGNPGGTVEFKDGGTDISGCAAQQVSTTTETATCTTSSLSVATHSITASYSGDGNFVGSSTATALSHVVNKATSTVTMAPSAPSTQGQTATFTAMAAAKAPGTGTPTGTVTFYDGTRVLGTGQLGVAGNKDQATFSTSGLLVGAHTITASYGGDGNFTTSTSTVITQYVNTNLGSYPKLPSGAYNLSNANLSGAYFVQVSLISASLTNSNLTGADFAGATLTGANFSNSNLKDADLTGSNLGGANLTNVNLIGATGMKTALLTNVVWSKTTCPDGSSSNADGGTCAGHF